MGDVEAAIALEERGEWSEAVAAYRGLLRQAVAESKREELLVRLAVCLLETGGEGRPEEAEDCLAEAQSRASPDPALRGRFLLAKGRLHDLRGEVQKALDHDVSARDVLEGGRARRSSG
jgi:hypothetical protein